MTVEEEEEEERGGAYPEDEDDYYDPTDRSYPPEYDDYDWDNLMG